jgi:tetratricopeptide (TPR) repeat protein
MSERVADFSPENISTLDRLVRSIDLAEGFALFIARCNVPVLRNDLILIARQQLAALGVEVVEVAFEDEPVNVRERLAAALAAADEDTEAPILVELPAARQSLVVAEPPAGYIVGGKRAVFVTGLELGIPFDQPNARVLAELNLGRDAFPRDVPHPLVIWLPDYAVTAVARCAPDFWAWRSGVFEFETGAVERSAALKQLAGDRPWLTLTNLSPEARLLRRRQLESLLDDYRDLPDDPRMTSERASILADLGHIGAAAQDHRNAAANYERALALYRQLSDQRNEAAILSSLGYVYDALGEKRKALDFYEQALPLRRQVGDRGGEATALSNIGAVYSALGDKRKALDFYEQALPLLRQVGDRGGEATTLNNLGLVYRSLGDMRKALDFYEQAVTILQKVRDRWHESMGRANLAGVYEALGDLAKAEEQLALVVALDEAIGHPDLASDRAALERVQARRGAGSGQRAAA